MVQPYILNGSPGHGEVYKWSPNNGGDQSLMTALFYKIIGKDVAFGASIFPKGQSIKTCGIHPEDASF